MKQVKHISEHPLAIRLPEPVPTSMTDFLSKILHSKGLSKDSVNESFADLPETVLLALASTSTDSDDLIRLAELSCEFVYDREGKLPIGLRYEVDAKGRHRPRILHPDLFEAMANNTYLPDIYKEVMVLRPGAQGDSEIVGECVGGSVACGAHRLWRHLKVINRDMQLRVCLCETMQRSQVLWPTPANESATDARREGQRSSPPSRARHAATR